MDKINWQITPYSPACHDLWNEMVQASRNATFLFRREYMDYHADRFTDASLIASLDGKPMALLPADRKGNELFSHRGLTYGGWILPSHKVDGDDMLHLFGAWTEWCRRSGITHIHYKPLPCIYARQPAQEDLYTLWRYEATIESIQLSSTIDTGCNPGFDYMRRRYLKRVAESGVTVNENADIAGFWHILEQCLAQRHHTSPVHSLEEMLRLQSLFPDAIKLYTASDDMGIQAGILIYHTSTTDHCQYIATTERGRKHRYLNYLVSKLIENTSARYFDFGTSNEQQGKILNASLLANKFGYGATGVAYMQYLIRL